MDPMHPGDRTYRNTAIRLADLTVVNGVLRDLTFENCTILGPAIVAMQGCSLNQCTFEGNEEGLFWDLGDRTFLIGAIGLIDCTIVGCRFQGIGVAVPPSQRDIWRQAMGYV